MSADLLDSIVDSTIAAEPTVSKIADSAADSDTIFGEGGDDETPLQDTQEVRTPVPPQSGEVFDPAIHAVDLSGNPIRKSNGEFKRKPGRKKGTQNVTASRVGEGVQPPNDEIARAAAYQTVSAIFLLGSIVGGDEFAPIVNKEMGYDEQRVMVDAWTAYYLTSDMKAIPPWVGVTIATGSYFALRFTMPKTQTRMQRLWGWIMEKWTGEKPAPKVEEK